MTKYREILRLKSLGFSERNIAQSCGISRNTVAKVLKKAAEINLSWPLDFDMTDSALEELMFPKDKSATNKRMPNFDYIRKELLRNGVNKKLLWVEYCEECRMSSEEPLMYSQFCYYIQKDEEKRRATMHIPRKPGEQIEVDWAGDPAHIIDPDTGEITDAWIFVGVLTYSQYAFVKAYMNEKTDNWIKAHIQMFDFFGGVTPMLVSDNCTTAVNHKKSDWYNTALNTTYHEMAEHYNLAILPARVRKPKDKPNVEGSVGKISTWITAALRNEQFFSLAELNASIREKLDAYNARKFQKKECSRLSLFLGEEMPLLAPLPATPFELAEWKQATVQFNYHIAVANRKDTLMTYLEDGHCSLSNTLSENAIRPFTVGRKNWLFSTSPKGAASSAIVYTMVEMAKANDLNTYKYLIYLLSQRPDAKMSDEQLEQLAPWSETAKTNCQN